MWKTTCCWQLERRCESLMAIGEEVRKEGQSKKSVPERPRNSCAKNI